MPVDPSNWQARVDSGAAPERLDQFVRRHLQASRTTVKYWFDAGYVRVNDRVVSKGYTLRPSDEVTVTVPRRAQPAGVELDVRYETPRVLVVNKPAHLPSIALAHSPHVALSELIAARYPELRDVGYRPGESGLLHRIDNETSGLLVAARDAGAFETLRAGMSQGTLQKRYFALVHGIPAVSQGVVDEPLAAHPTSRNKVTVDAAGHAARSVYRVVARGEELCAITITIETAYRHQIRAHLAHLGCPLLNDPTYGGAPWPGLERHALHALSVHWGGAVDLPAFTVTAPLPDDLAAVASSGGLDLTAILQPASDA